MEENLTKTCLHDRHVALGALMSPFGGFDMPIQYKGITEEHNAVRCQPHGRGKGKRHGRL